MAENAEPDYGVDMLMDAIVEELPCTAHQLIFDLKCKRPVDRFRKFKNLLPALKTAVVDTRTSMGTYVCGDPDLWFAGFDLVMPGYIPYVPSKLSIIAIENTSNRMMNWINCTVEPYGISPRVTVMVSHRMFVNDPAIFWRLWRKVISASVVLIDREFRKIAAPADIELYAATYTHDSPFFIPATGVPNGAPKHRFTDAVRHAMMNDEDEDEDEDADEDAPASHAPANQVWDDTNLFEGFNIPRAERRSPFHRYRSVNV